jgi:hypothetical protein
MGCQDSQPQTDCMQTTTTPLTKNTIVMFFNRQRIFSRLLLIAGLVVTLLCTYQVYQVIHGTIDDNLSKFNIERWIVIAGSSATSPVIVMLADNSNKIIRLQTHSIRETIDYAEHHGYTLIMCRTPRLIVDGHHDSISYMFRAVTRSYGIATPHCLCQPTTL